MLMVFNPSQSEATATRGANVMLLGAPGTGKSFLAECAMRDRVRVVVVDPAGGWGSFDWSRDPETIARLVATTEGPFRLSWRCDGASVKEIVSGVGQIAAAARNCTLIIDEAAAIKRAEIPELDNGAIRAGRHRGVSVWLISQRAADIPPSRRQGIDCAYIYRAVEWRDREAIREFAGRDIANDVQHLPDRVCYRIDLRSGDSRLYRMDNAQPTEFAQ